MNTQMVPGPEQTELESLRRERRDARQARRLQQLRAKFILWSAISVSSALLIVLGLIYLQVQNLLSLPQPINGVSCDQGEQVAFHIHAHLSMYIDGKKITIPKYIGIAGNPPENITCFYWLHTHSTDGIIHIEAPRKQSNEALDDFLAIWHDGFSKLGFPQELNKTTGWSIFINGKPFTDQVTSPVHTEVPLNSHDIVTLEYGSPLVPPDTSATYQFPKNLPK